MPAARASISTGATRLTLYHGDPRHATLDRGEALFTVVHDAANPFEVSVGGATLRDVGTVFNVTRDDHATTVAVAEGEVLYNPDRERVSLPAGRSLRAVDDDTRLVVGEIAPGLVAAWREGRLVYDGARLDLVAADLSRNLGERVTVSPALAAMPVRATISIDRDHDAVIRRLAALLAIHAQRTPQGWELGTTP